MSNFPASLGRDIRLAGASSAPTTSYVYDPDYPDITATNIWQQLFQLWIKSIPPLGHRVYCGVTVPDSSDDAVCLAAAARLSVAVENDETADALSNRLIDVAGTPWTTPDP